MGPDVGEPPGSSLPGAGVTLQAFSRCERWCPLTTYFGTPLRFLSRSAVRRSQKPRSRGFRKCSTTGRFVDGYEMQTPKALIVLGLSTPVGVLEGGIWATLLTSSSPATHGMFSFNTVKARTYDLEIGMYADRLPVPPFSVHMSRARKRVAISALQSPRIGRLTGSLVADRTRDHCQEGAPWSGAAVSPQRDDRDANAGCGPDAAGASRRSRPSA